MLVDTVCFIGTEFKYLGFAVKANTVKTFRFFFVRRAMCRHCCDMFRAPGAYCPANYVTRTHSAV